MKKGKEIILKIQDQATLDTYLDPNLNKLVIINAYEKFWGPVEIIDPWVRRFLDEEDNIKKMTFISVDFNINHEIWGKISFNSKPLFFIFHKGVLIETVEGIDLPKLTEKIEKSLALL